MSQLENEWLVRFDSAIEFKRHEETDEGYLKVFGVAAKTGVMEYVNEDGSPRLELVDDKTLAESYKDLEHQPIVVEHPHVPGRMLNADNVLNYQKGEVIESAFNEDTGENEVVLLIRDARTIDKVKSKELLGLSPGYKLQRKPAPDGAGYHYVQRRRKYNHLALTKTPRRGKDTSIRLDSAENAIQPETEMPKEKEGENQPNVEVPNLDGLEGKVDALAATVASLADTVQALVPDEPAEPADEGENTDADERLQWFNERTKALAVAEELDVEVDANVDSNADIKRKVVEAHLGEENFDSEASDGYVDGVFAYVQKDSKEKREEKGSLDSLGASFQLPNPGFKPGVADNKPKFADPTALEHGRAPRNTQEG